MQYSSIFSNILWCYTDLTQQLVSGSSFFPNCFFLVAVTALLINLQNIYQSFRLKTDSQNSAFFAYKLIFATILCECLSLVICLDGFKIQMGIMVWIIYMSALMILLLVFLTLTLDEFLYKDSYRESSKFDTVELNSNQSSFSAIFGFFIFIPVFFYLSVDFLYCIQESSQISHLFYNDTNGSLAVLSAESAYSDIMHTISIDISSSFMEYLLSGLLQSVCLISVIALIIFK